MNALFEVFCPNVKCPIQTVGGTPEDFQVEVNSNGDYNVFNGTTLWLKIAPTFITVNNKRSVCTK